jgi:hypothetical protein
MSAGNGRDRGKVIFDPTLLLLQSDIIGEAVAGELGPDIFHCLVLALGPHFNEPKYKLSEATCSRISERDRVRMMSMGGCQAKAHLLAVAEWRSSWKDVWIESRKHGTPGSRNV